MKRATIIAAVLILTLNSSSAFSTPTASSEINSITETSGLSIANQKIKMVPQTQALQDLSNLIPFQTKFIPQKNIEVNIFSSLHQLFAISITGLFGLLGLSGYFGIYKAIKRKNKKNIKGLH